MDSTPSKFKKKCGCTIHENDASPLRRLQGSIMRKAPVKDLIKHGLLDARKTYICIECLHTAEKLSINNTGKTNQQLNVNEGEEDMDVQENVTIRVSDDEMNAVAVGDDEMNVEDGNKENDSKTDWSNLTEANKEDYISMAKNLGKMIQKDLYTDSCDILKNYKQCEQTPLQWLSERHPLLVSFLEGCTSVCLQEDTTDSPKKNQLSSTCYRTDFVYKKFEHGVSILLPTKCRSVHRDRQ